MRERRACFFAPRRTVLFLASGLRRALIGCFMCFRERYVNVSVSCILFIRFHFTITQREDNKQAEATQLCVPGQKCARRSATERLMSVTAQAISGVAVVRVVHLTQSRKVQTCCSDLIFHP